LEGKRRKPTRIIPDIERESTVRCTVHLLVGCVRVTFKLGVGSNQLFRHFEVEQK
jgi:hypothetical protein